MELQRRLRVIYSWKIFNITVKNCTIYPIDLRPLKSITLSNLECVNNVTDHMLVGCSTFFLEIRNGYAFYAKIVTQENL